MQFSIIQRVIKHNQVFFVLYAGLAALCTYSCMYAFRKPFAVATFNSMVFLGLDYKIWLIISQGLGYLLSKFLGIKIVSEMKSKYRARAIVSLILLAEVGLFLFAITPAPYNIIFMFFNGLPLGMVWGLVFSYLEGRRSTEILGSLLCVSFIFSSGFVKTIGKVVMINWGVSEFWMPFVTGTIFIIPLIIFVWLLDQLPAPDEEDMIMRTERNPMNKASRMNFFRTFSPGLVALIVVYVVLTTYRDFRDNFAAELWNSLGYGDNASIFTLTEIPVSIGVLIITGSMFVIKNNIRALYVNHYLIMSGALILGFSTFFFTKGFLGAPAWMILAGFGLYLGYVPFNAILFDRLIAAFRYPGTAGFLIYLADSFGYLGSMAGLLYKNFGNSNIKWVDFFVGAGYIMVIFCLVFITLSLIYFKRKYARERKLRLSVLN